MNTNIIGDRVAKLEFGDDPVTDVTYSIHLEGGQVLNVWNGQPSFGPQDTAIGDEVGARLVAISLTTNHRGDEYLHYRFE